MTESFDANARPGRLAKLRGSWLSVIGILAWSVWTIGILITVLNAVRKIEAEGVVHIALGEYLHFIDAFWSGGALYLPDSLVGFHYLPIMLVVFTPLSWISAPLAAGALGLVSAVFFAFSVYRLAREIVPERPAITAGLLLVVCEMAAVISLSLMHVQLLMVGAMICAAVAGMQGRWRAFAIWITLAIALKPLSIVMALLAAAIVPQTRLPLFLGVVVLVFSPFAVRDWFYLSTQYADYVRQLLFITNAGPGAWHLQADFSTLFKTVGFEIDARVRFAIRAIAAFCTLALVWRVAALQNARATGFALLILSSCYIGLFNPKQEIFSFIVVVPAIAALGVIMLARDISDWRGWLWFALVLDLSMRWGMRSGPWMYPAAMVLVWAGLLALLGNPQRWGDLLSKDSKLPANLQLLSDTDPLRS